ncbi:MAG: FHA domain-containing protein, partial [Gemmatimonadetes bacterium]|nr:FHA domain-containing protein [Gemmatimonadota bacterium]
MSDVPRLRPLAPLSGAAHPVSDPPFWIGRDPSCALVLSHPGLAARHCVLVEREDGWWLRPQAPVTVAGRASTDPVRLQPDVVIELAPGLSFRFEEGESARVERAPVVVRREAQAVEPPRPRTPRPPRHPRKRERGPSTLTGGPTLFVAAVLLALAVGIGVALRRAQAPPALTPEEAALFQTLMTEATERMERGSTLLELGQPELALAEFARAINGVETSTLGRHPWVQARLATFEAAVGALYRARRMDVPARFGVDADG